MRLLVAFCLIALLVPVSGLCQSAPAANAVASQEQQVAEGEKAAIKALRAMNAAQASFKSACGQGFFVSGLLELGKPPEGANVGFLAPALSGAASVTKDGYTFKMASSQGAVATSPESCNGLPAGSLVRGYYATATPMPGSGGRHFGTNTTGAIFYGNSPLKMTDQSSDGSPLK
jgi:hypothetical protein